MQDMTFEVPRSYAALFDAGRFEYWGVPYRSMTADERVARYAERRSQVLWLEAIEWDPTRSPAEITARPESDDTLPGLVRFAANGGGDAYCWYLPWRDGPEPPVLLCPHDSTEAEYFAPDFARCLERLWLLHGAWCDREARDLVLADLRSWLSILEPHLDRDRVAALRALADGVDAAGFRAAERSLVESWPRASDTLRGHDLLSTRYTVEYLGKDALRLYDESIAFFEKLIADGHPRFASKLEETRRNREAAVLQLAAKGRRKATKKKPAKARKAVKSTKPARSTKAAKSAKAVKTTKAVKSTKPVPRKAAASARKTTPKKPAKARG